MSEDLLPEGDSEGLADLHRVLVRRLIRFTAPPLSGAAGAVLVRGCLPPPERQGVTRVVLWDGHALESSVAYDLPLTCPEDGNIPWSHLIGAFRRVLSSPPSPAGTDPTGIPLADARSRVLEALDSVTFDTGDALHAAASMLQPPDEPEGGGRLLLDGFLLQDRATARLYVTAPGIVGSLGLDVSLCDESGRVRVGNTALMAALPSLVPDELDHNRSPAQDPYAPAGVYDFTHW
ncbi:hypothetical protein [Streptomyces roseolus]|uniref:hypothetical protein n=1 Tax=Streptomyces roseolus TaxID=67358 RepID=UPI001671C6FC|nr:hypothetical protein [Streptomyces roseolus]GGR23379.1 hypothetical protein GCM10010282_14510 [Streptomyces roseolus]